jgi:hypothetical protein
MASIQYPGSVAAAGRKVVINSLNVVIKVVIGLGRAG